MTPSTPSFAGYSHLRKGPARSVSTIGTILFTMLLVILAYYIGREVLFSGHELFDGGR